MIKFPCHCGFEFEVPQEMAGNSLQCPRCMRLADIPLLSDLNQLEGDGTIRLEPLPLEETREAELKRAYMPRRHDDAGNEIDMRQSFKELVEAGADEVPLELKDEIRPGAPKYDPVTGELIKPLTMRGDEAQTVIPIAAGAPTLQYQKNYTTPGRSIWAAPLLMFTPGSAAVLAILYIVHLITLAIWVPIGGGLAFALFVVAFIYLMVIAHFANVVEEVGPNSNDELPTPLRNVSWWEDVIMPWFNFTIAYLYCFVPWMVMFFSARIQGSMGMRAWAMTSLSLLAIGTFLFPAVFLTTTTSGSILNLRPDRVFGVIATIGWRYLIVLALWVIGGGIYWFSSIVAIAYVSSLMQTFLFFKQGKVHVGLAMGGIFVGIYLLHVFCWVLGLFYRHHHTEFPWVLQRFVSQRKVERRIPRRPSGVVAAQVKDPGFLVTEPPPKLRTKPASARATVPQPPKSI
jgi:hypothetical protein